MATSEAQRRANSKYYETIYKAKRKAKLDEEKLNKFKEWLNYYNSTYNTQYTLNQ